MTGKHHDDHKNGDKSKGVDAKTGQDRDNPTGVDAGYNTKPPGDEQGGDVSAHPSPATDPTNQPPEPTQWTKDNPRPPLPKGRDYVAGQPVTQDEYELTEKEAAERVRPEAWKRAEGAGVEVEEGMKDASTGWDRTKEGTRPDARPLRDPTAKDDDINKAPGGVGGQGTRADGRARSPDLQGEGPTDRGEYLGETGMEDEHNRHNI
jgi:hypothetical protein